MKPKIPHTFHRVWVAESGPIPDVFAGYGRTWLDLNPGWESYLWSQFPEWGTNQHEWEIAETFSEKSDVLRYEVIYHYGGVYIDTDFENFKPIGDLIDSSPHGFIACPEFVRDGWIHFAAGFFAATKGHPILAEIIEGMPESFRINDSPTTRGGPTYLQSILHKHLGEITIVPAHLFYPYHGGQVWRHEDHPDAIAAHHWAASWRK